VVLAAAESADRRGDNALRAGVGVPYRGRRRLIGILHRESRVMSRFATKATQLRLTGLLVLLGERLDRGRRRR